MNKKLPGLSALRTFEATARHLSFSKAADELNVSAAAVSSQVRSLEEQLGVQLFRRSSRFVRLTPAGETLSVAASKSFALLETAMDKIQRAEGSSRLSLTASPSIAPKWLIPRLERFSDTHPDIEIRLDASLSVANLEEEGFDVAIRFGDGQYPGMHVAKLSDESVFPVCSPKLIDRVLDDPKELLRYTLLHVDWEGQVGPWPNWNTWLTTVGLKPTQTKDLHFNHTLLAIEAAIAGHGIALGKRSLVEADLKSGRLIQPHMMQLRNPENFGYYLVSPKKALERDAVRAFYDWILAEMSRGETVI